MNKVVTNGCQLIRTAGACAAIRSVVAFLLSVSSRNRRKRPEVGACRPPPVSYDEFSMPGTCARDGLVHAQVTG